MGGTDGADESDSRLESSSTSKPLISSVQLKESQRGWNFSDAMGFPGADSVDSCCTNSCTQLHLYICQVPLSSPSRFS